MSAFARGYKVMNDEKSDDEIGNLHRHFHRMKDQVEQAQKERLQEQRAKEYLVATISHDLKNPLTAIKAFAELLQESRFTSDEQKAYNEVIVQKVDFMRQMLDDLASYVILQSKNFSIELVDFDGNEFFDIITSGYEPLGQDKSLRLTVYNNVTGTYAVHPKQWIRVADNLMTNAIKYTPRRGNIVICALSERKENLLKQYVVESFTFQFRTMHILSFKTMESELIVKL